MFIMEICDDLSPVIRLIQKGLIPVIQIGIPIILIVLGMFDLWKAVVASKEYEIKSAQKLLIKRVVYAIAIFFVVFLVHTVFNVVAENDAETAGAGDWWRCWEKVRNS